MARLSELPLGEAAGGFAAGVSAEGVTVRFALDAIGGATPAQVDSRIRVGSTVLEVQPSYAGTVTRTLQSDLNDTISAKRWGAKGDRVADDTASLQAAINALQGSRNTVIGTSAARLWLAAGSYLSGPLYQTRPLEIAGENNNTTELVLKNGSLDALLNYAVSHDGFDYPANGSPGGRVILRDLVLRHQGGRNEVAGRGVAHGIRIRAPAERPVYTGFWFSDVAIHAFPGSGFYYGGNALAGGGGHNLSSLNCYGDAFYMNSANDWYFRGGNWGACGGIAHNIAGSGQVQWVQTNLYSSAEALLYVFEDAAASGSREVQYFGCSFDRGQKHGIIHDIRNHLSALTLNGCFLRLNGSSAPGTFSDVFVTNTAAPNTFRAVADTKFYATRQDRGTLNPNWNIEFQAGATAEVDVSGATFSEGGYGRASISNRRDLLRTGNGALRSYASGRVSGLALPTSAAGLASGDLWRDGTTLRVVA